jgi:thiol-disulfide isomerase/thioredoxin
MNGAIAKRVKASVIGTGSYLPERILWNAELEKMVDTTDEWIVTRTGIRARHIARDDESTSDMAAVAAQRAIESAGIDPMDIGVVLVATCTPDSPMPNTACFVQEKIKAGWYASVSDGLAAAQREQKPVLIDLWATWCKNCLTMDKTTFEDPAVMAALSNYVKIKFQAEDPDAQPAKAVMQRFHAVGLPTYVILRPKPVGPKG